MKIKKLLTLILLLAACSPDYSPSPLKAQLKQYAMLTTAIDSNFYVPDSFAFRYDYECFIINLNGNGKRRTKRHLNIGDFQYGDTNIYTRLSQGKVWSQVLSKFNFIADGWTDKDSTNTDTFTFVRKQYTATYIRPTQILTIKKLNSYVVRDAYIPSFNEYDPLIHKQLRLWVRVIPTIEVWKQVADSE